MHTKMVLGGPGTGKTSRLLSIVEEELDAGTKPESIAFVSFTKAAVEEARNRAVERFGFTAKRLPFFRTLHSLCFTSHGLMRRDVVGPKHLAELSKIVGIKLTGRNDPDLALSTGDRLLFLEGLARVTYSTLEDVLHKSPDPEISLSKLQYFSNTLKAYKQRRGLWDFTDMLLRFSEHKLGPVPVTVALIDEAQDLSPAQWRVVETAFSDVDRMYIAGDDDQAIYAWSGADINHFLDYKADETEVLPRSHRLPRTVFDYAQSIAGQITKRYAKDWEPDKTREGYVGALQSLASLDLQSGSWLMLARNACFLKQFENECDRQGIVYSTRFGNSVSRDDVAAIRAYEWWRRGHENPSAEDKKLVLERTGRKKLIDEGIWHDAFRLMSMQRRSYYLTVMRNKIRLTSEPRVHINTIHSTKGGEADNVVLATDITRKTADAASHSPDDEWRVYYVGATRAKSNLYVLLPQTNTFLYQPVL